MFISAIIVAGGRGERMKSPVPKQFLDINGVSLISLSIIFFEKLEIVNEVIIVILPEWIEHLENNILSKGSFKKVSKIVEGGKFRQDSFENGLIHSKGEIVIDHESDITSTASVIDMDIDIDIYTFLDVITNS